MAVWKGRIQKTYQDNLNQDRRARKQNWDKRIAWMQKHKPVTSRDWLKYK